MLHPRVLIKKANLTFAVKFFCLLVNHRLSPMAADNILIWERVIMVTALVTRFEIDFAKLLISIIHERDFKTFTTYPFTCMIFGFVRMLECPFGTVILSVLRPEKWILVSTGMRSIWWNHGVDPELICSR